MVVWYFVENPVHCNYRRAPAQDFMVFPSVCCAWFKAQLTSHTFAFPLFLLVLLVTFPLGRAFPSSAKCGLRVITLLRCSLYTHTASSDAKKVRVQSRRIPHRISVHNVASERGVSLACSSSSSDSSGISAPADSCWFDVCNSVASRPRFPCCTSCGGDW